jgi:DNA-binding transcriptional MerR regulator
MTSMHNNNRKPVRKLSTSDLCARYGVVPRTIERWTAAGILPPPMNINRRKYWGEDGVEQCDRDRVTKQQQPQSAA